MIKFQLLGVFQTLYPDGQMDIGRALIISLVGFLIVLLILGILALFVKAMGMIFDTINAKKETASSTAGNPIVSTAKPEAVKANNGPLSVDLIDVTDEEAVCVMAVVSNQSGIPLNRLKFNYIKKISEE